MHRPEHCRATYLLLSIALLARWDTATAATITANPPASPTFSQGGFEQPDLAANTFLLGPTGSAWTFAAITGIAANGSGYANPAAPEGDQVGIVTNDQASVIAQSFVAPAGRYELAFKSAQQPANHQSISARIDGTQVALAAPSGSQWQSYTSTRFDLAAGSHSVGFVGLDPGGDHTAFVDDVRLNAVGYLVDGGFERPDVPAGTHVFAPTGSAWTFDASSGIAANGSAFGTPSAPEGDQAAIMRAGSAFSQSFSVTQSGRYRLSFKAAQRNPTAMRARITLDGAVVGDFKPAGTSYQSYVFDALLLTAGTHVLTVDDSGVAQRGPALALDDLRLTSTTLTASRWSDPATWSGGVVPGWDDDVVIPPGAVVLLDTAAQAKTLKIQGELHCDDQDVSLDTYNASVTGRLVCGSPFARYVDQFTLTLYGDDQGAGGMHGHKFLTASAPGVIELHGEQRRGWTQLRATANAGKSGINLVDPVEWRAGDDIVIAPTLDDPTQGEVVTVTAVSPDGLQVSFEPPLSYRHYGEQSTYTNGVSSWTLDERAEVALLTRNIRIQGDASPTSNEYGGHMMTMAGASIRASGIELFRMGQKKLLRRYPFHWHVAGDVSGQYIESSSVHESYNRCVTIHGTNHARVADNVCYDFRGHGYFLEDGIEQHNVLDGNLAVWARRPAAGDELLESDRRIGTASNGPAAFWISNPTNTLTRNVAAGSEGSGFW